MLVIMDNQRTTKPEEDLKNLYLLVDQVPSLSATSTSTCVRDVPEGEIASFRGGLATKSDKRAENVRERAEYRAVVNRGSLRSQVGQIPVKESLFPMEALAPVNYANTRLRSIGIFFISYHEIN
ncbi:hypothetical protein ABEB36_015592 [Hypothenemus hampei]|uniref:Uncharacterized protein n=1 Tax=Hypothenemus hampei TaxID=57062 RepID=A0ABD1E1C3_HYPHA